MNIETTIKMTLEDSEIEALKTLKETYIQCGITEQFSCECCPLLYGDMCIAKYAELIIDKRGLK